MDIRRTDHLHAARPHWSERGDAPTVLAEIAQGTPASSVGFAADAPDAKADKPLDVMTPLSNTSWGSRRVRIDNTTGRIHVLEKSQ